MPDGVVADDDLGVTDGQHIIGEALPVRGLRAEASSAPAVTIQVGHHLPQALERHRKEVGLKIESCDLLEIGLFPYINQHLHRYQGLTLRHIRSDRPMTSILVS